MAWYIVPYKIDVSSTEIPIRYCAIDDFTNQLSAAGGLWGEIEMLGDRAIVKVKAPPVVLDFLDSRFRRLPKNKLDDSLADLPPTTRYALRNELIDAGYSTQEIRHRLGGVQKFSEFRVLVT